MGVNPTWRSSSWFHDSTCVAPTVKIVCLQQHISACSVDKETFENSIVCNPSTHYGLPCPNCTQKYAVARSLFPQLEQYMLSRARGGTPYDFFPFFKFLLFLLFTRISPIGICSLIAAKLAGMGDIGKAFEMLGYVMGTAVAGLFIHGVIVLPLIYFIFTRKNPIIYIKNLSDAIATAYGTDSRLVTRSSFMY